jgi:hypothetical protein
VHWTDRFVNDVFRFFLMSQKVGSLENCSVKFIYQQNDLDIFWIYFRSSIRWGTSLGEKFPVSTRNSKTAFCYKKNRFVKIKYCQIVKHFLIFFKSVGKIIYCTLISRQDYPLLLSLGYSVDQIPQYPRLTSHYSQF